jgi:hypothetical protein
MAKKLSNTEINGIVTGMIGQSVGWSDSKLARERADILDYYNGKKPAKQHAGSSSYVSTDVYDAVESMKAQLLETFASGYDIMKFAPVGPDDVATSRIATDYTNYVIFQKNNGYQIMSDVIHDGLIARVGVVKVYWDPTEEFIDEEFKQIDEQTAMGLMAQDDITEFEAELDPETGTYTGTLKRMKKSGQVRIDNIPPEEFLISTDAVSLDAAPFAAHRTLKTRSELIKLGFDEKVVKKLPTSSRSLVDFNSETYNRFDPVSTGMGTTGFQDANGKIAVFECYVNLDIDKSGKTQLYRVVKAGEQILEKEEVDRKPFLVFNPLPVPHSFWGNNFAARVVPFQNARTNLVRSVLDHASITVNPRYQVLKGGLINPRELLDNRLGGIVNITRPDAVTPLMQAQLNQFVFPTIQLLDGDKESSTGISQLSQGLNKDAISTQNSQGLIEQMVSLSQQRQKIIARNFANNFLVPLFFEVYRLVLGNEDRRQIVQLTGQWVEVDPTTWIERKDATVSFSLGYGEQEKEAQKHFELHRLLTEDPALKDLYSIQGRFKNVSDMMKIGGFKNVTDYLTPPEKANPPEPDPMMLAEVDYKKAQTQALTVQADAAMLKAQANAEFESMKTQIAMMQAEIAKFKAQTDASRKDFEVVNRVDIAHRELEAAARLDDQDKKAIYSANS